MSKCFKFKTYSLKNLKHKQKSVIQYTANTKNKFVKYCNYNTEFHKLSKYNGYAAKEYLNNST